MTDLTRATAEPEGDRELQPGADASQALAFFAATDPDRVLIEDGGHPMTYAQADGHVDALAARLVRDHGGGSGMVAIRMDDSAELLVASLAVLRAGLTSVPIDPAAPAEWVLDVLADVEAVALVNGSPGLPPELDVPVLPAFVEDDGTAADADLPRPPRELAAISFTSGSTGRPKGIMVTRAMRPSVKMQLIESTGLSAQRMRVGLLGTGSGGTTEMAAHAMATLGATAAVYNVRQQGAAGLASWLVETQVSAFHTVPTVLRQAMATMDPGERLETLKIVVLSGEAATWEDVALLRRHLPDDATVLNMFGQTETLGLAMLPITSATELGTGPLPIGYPMEGRTLRVVDEDGAEVPDGETGELLVEDDGVALGYWRRPEATARTFADLGDGRRRVRTGDRVRKRPDGMFDHAGRTDHLVKVGAVRIELGQVEAALKGLTGVTSAAARTYEDGNGRTRLAGYVVTDPGATISSAGARAALARTLPSTMLPTVVVPLAALPQLPGGKVDRAALPEPAVATPSDAGPPEGETQELLARLFADALGVPAVGADDDFFELGGDSLAAVEVLAGVEAALGIDVPPTTLVEASTVARLATMLELGDGTWPTVVPVRTEGELTPLVVLHAIRGEVFFAELIARDLRADRPVYGIRASREPQDASVAAIAARYVEELRAARPSGPYVLYGFSFGGYVAFEMARILADLGERVEALVLGDVGAPAVAHAGSGQRPSRGWRVESRVVLGRWRRKLMRSATPAPAARAVAPEPLADPDELVAAQALLEEGRPIPRELRMAAAVAHHSALLEGHRPGGRVAVPVTLLVAEAGQVRQMGGGRTHGWDELVDGPVTTVAIPGRHGDLARAAGTPHVARAIEAALARGA